METVEKIMEIIGFNYGTGSDVLRQRLICLCKLARKEERQKVVDEVRKMTIKQISSAESIYNAILEGGKK